MQYRCSRCHTHFRGPEHAKADGGDDSHGGEGLSCPQCKAEAGLEPVKRVPPAMLMFAMFLGTALIASVVGGLVTMVSG